MRRKRAAVDVKRADTADLSIRGEARYIAGRAMARDCRVVTIGALVLFSTDTGDAWMLDPEDGLALCLARDGDSIPANITETDERFAVGWTHAYRIEGEMMILADDSGQSRSIRGYPTREIARAFRRARFIRRR